MTEPLPVWEDGRGLSLPPLPSDVTLEADLLVVGLGASGLAAVHAGLDRGLRVVGLDAGIVGGGAAGRNGGFALAGVAEFHHDAAQRWGRDWAATAYEATLRELRDRPPATFRATGSLRIAASPDEYDDCVAQHDTMRADGLPVEHYDGPEGRGLLFPVDGAIDPLARARAMAAAAVDRGARLFERTAWPSEQVHAAATVVCVDGRLEQVLPALRGRVRTTRLQMLATAPVTAEIAARPVYRRYGYDYWQQLPSGEVVAGGCRDRFEAAEWAATTAEPTTDVQSCIEQLAREVIRIPAGTAITARWAGLVGYTDDRLPVVEPVDHRGQRVVACGAYSGTGNIVGVLCARAAVDLALDGTSRSPFVNRPGSRPGKDGAP